MSMRRLLFGLVVLLIAGAYVAGYWPEHQRRLEAQSALAERESRLAAAEARNRLADVLGLLLRLMDSVEARNFGEAVVQASAYFDRAGQEAPTLPEARGQLDDIRGSRDRVVAALALTDASILEELRRQELTLRQALGFPIP